MDTNKSYQIIRVAKKYYESHMDQKIIAQEEGISVSTVSRMLKKAEVHHKSYASKSSRSWICESNN